MGNAAWSLAILLMRCLFFPTRTTECAFALITVEPVCAIHLASVTMGMAFFLDHRAPNRFFRAALTASTITAISNQPDKGRVQSITEPLKGPPYAYSIAHEVVRLVVSLLLCSERYHQGQ